MLRNTLIFLQLVPAIDIALALLAIPLLKLEKKELNSSLGKMKETIEYLRPDRFIDDEFNLKEVDKLAIALME